MTESIISEKETAELIHRFLSRHGRATEDEVRYYLDLETRIRIDQAQQRLLEQGKVTATWDDRKQDYMVALK